ncbi:serine hydrolase domain-containing protein [Chitinophaga japonensis]|uniref:CubicO group peptidase (Beta-lactamase class C family) n=1 Tax=Chitinophaga japonensis TaxID=104662 RepID=A0A562T3B1_CHIJA|nr:serine hydrolase domain-containing protein [Chitinophaga japonensis]TWI87808.1 CubicO group peptidase (beta-lactamase class C family) [Chitinophaga japonensis]
MNYSPPPKKSLLFATHLLIGLCTLSMLANAQSGTKVITDPIVLPAAEKFMANPKAVGLSIGIYDQGRQYTYHFGTTAKGKATRPADSTLYTIASITKTFTALLLAQATIEKKVKLDDDIRKYLKGDYPNLEYAGQPVRLFHLVSHVSRLPFAFTELAGKPGYSREDFFEQLHTVRIDTVPGVKYQYSNPAAILLSYILEDVYGKSFEGLLKEKIFDPLGMKHSGIRLSESEMGCMATGYTAQGQPDTSSYIQMGAAGGLKSDISDMLLYLKAQIKEDSEAIRLTRKESWGFEMGNGSRYSCGLNWQLITKPDGNRRIFQDGNVPGYSSKIVLFPAKDIGVIVLSNTFLPDELSELAETILTGLRPQDRL